MPTPTFDALPARKRDAFVRTALEEFAAHDYESASVSRIVAALRIAKGSVYQYFTDKKDLYLHLVDHAQTVMLVALEEGRASPDADFFASLRALMSANVLAARRHPLESALLERAYRSTGPFSDELGVRGHRLRREYLLAMVAHAQDRGDLDPRADPALVALVVDGVIAGIGPWLDARLPGSGPGRYDDERVEAAFDQAVELLRRGIGPLPSASVPAETGRSNRRSRQEAT